MLVPKTLAFAVLRRRKQATEFGAMWELLDGHVARQTANIADVWTGSFRLGEQLDACATYHLTLQSPGWKQQSKACAQRGLLSNP